MNLIKRFFLLIPELLFMPLIFPQYISENIPDGLYLHPRTATLFGEVSVIGEYEILVLRRDHPFAKWHEFCKFEIICEKDKLPVIKTVDLRDNE